MSSTVRFRLPSLLEVDLPIWFINSSEAVSHLLECGFNAVVFAPLTPSSAPMQRISWHEFFSTLDAIRSRGIQVGLHFSSHQKNIQLFDAINNVAHAFDCVFWKQNDLQYDLQFLHAADLLESEKAFEEISSLEQQIKKQIFYFISTKSKPQAKRQAFWMLDLVHRIGKKTVLGFMSDMPLHPLFNALERQPAGAQFPLMPFISLSTFQLIDAVLGRQIHNRFCGAGCLVGEFPQRTAADALPLWVAGQRMCQPLSLDLYQEQWIEKNNISIDKYKF